MWLRREIIVVLGSAAVVACGSPGDAPGGGDAADGRNGDSGPGDDDHAGTFVVCDQASPPADLPAEEWQHTGSELLADLNEPDHVGLDGFGVHGESAVVRGKFAYAPSTKDLEDELVEVWLDDCSGSYVSLGRVRTDSDGRIALPVPAEHLGTVGAFAVYMRVVGDNSSARSTVRILPAQSHVMVIDIDGTLTTGDDELFRDLADDILAGTYVPEARSGAVELTQTRRRDQGYQLVYLTSRPYNFVGRSRQWLTSLGFAPGSLRTAQSWAAVAPTEGAAGDYKASYLESLVDAGFVIDAAYGNATTDIYAYERAGIPKAHTFILGEHGGEENTVDLGEAYDAHLSGLDPSNPAPQPFQY